MKPNLKSYAGLAILLFIGSTQFILSQPAAHPTSAEKTSFQEVTSQLDPGGNLYLYLDTEQWVKRLSTKVSNLRGLLGAIPDIKDEDRQHLEKVFNVLTNLIRTSGLEDVSGFGVSSIATEKDFYHTKALVHHYPGKGSGFIWNLFGQKPHPLDGLDLLGTNTALAGFGDMDVSMLWSMLQKQIGDSGFPEAEQALQKVPEGFENATQLNWDKVLASLGGEFGFVLSLDQSKMVSIPVPSGGTIEIPSPSIMLVIKVKNDTIFNRLDELMAKSGQSVFKTDKPNLKMRTLPLPLPLPIQLAPTIATSGGYLFLGSTDLIVTEALAVKAGERPGLKSTSEFKKLAHDIPTQGNRFSFLSQRFGATIKQIQENALGMAPGVSESQKDLLKSVLGAGQSGFSYAVSANTEQGWMAVGNGNQHPARQMLVASAVPVAIAAGLAVPAFSKAKQSSQKAACINNLRQIESAKKKWAAENKKTSDDAPLPGDLLTYLKANKFPSCPSGGEYSIHQISEEPTCSQSGHTLEK